MDTGRRTFLRQSCLFCASALASQLSSCTPTLPIYHLKISGNAIQVPVATFDNSDITIVRDDEATYDILVVKYLPLQYYSVYMRCTHADYGLGTTPDGIRCQAHGAVFNYDGTVRTGPATEPLLTFPTELDTNNGIITIDINALKI